MSPSANKIFNISVEAKNVERLDVRKTFTVHFNKYEKDGRLKVLIHSKNRALTLVTLEFTDFLNVYKHSLPTPPPTPEDAQ